MRILHYTRSMENPNSDNLSFNRPGLNPDEPASIDEVTDEIVILP